MSWQKVAWTALFWLASVGLTYHATGSASAAAAVFFGIWATAGIVEMNSSK